LKSGFGFDSEAFFGFTDKLMNFLPAFDVLIHAFSQ
jgi:hypothetical protein